MQTMDAAKAEAFALEIRTLCPMQCKQDRFVAYELQNGSIFPGGK